MFLRVYRIDKVPPSPDWDEAALGYNAYSILKTGRDEFGTLLPLSLRSFNDYKPAFYVYTAIPSVLIFGLNTFAVRLPSAIMGTLTVLGMFFLCEALRKFFSERISIKYSFFGAFMLAVSPWHLQFSRAAFEVNSALFLLVWGMVFLLYGLEKPKLLLGSAILFGLSLYAYHSSRIFLPLLLLLTFALFRDQLLKFKKYLIASLVIGFLISLPVVFILLSPEGQKRFAGVSIYSDQTGLLRDNVIKIDQDNKLGNSFANFWHNRRFTYVSRFVEGYLWHYTPQWLFLSGDAVGRHHAPEMGLLYLFELPFILIGLYKTVSEKSKAGAIILFWLLAAPIAAAPTNQVPHAVRSYFLLPGLIMVSSLGIYYLYKYKTTAIKRAGINFFLISIFIVSFIYYLEKYYIHLPREYSSFWQFGYRETFAEVQKISHNYDQIVFSGKLEQPYIFYLFYLKYDPKVYQSFGGSKKIDFNDWSHLVLGKMEFKLMDWKNEKKNSRILYIGRPQDFSGETKIIKKIYYLDGKEAIWMVEG